MERLIVAFMTISLCFTAGRGLGYNILTCPQESLSPSLCTLATLTGTLTGTAGELLRGSVPRPTAPTTIPGDTTLPIGEGKVLRDYLGHYSDKWLGLPRLPRIEGPITSVNKMVQEATTNNSRSSSSTFRLQLPR